MPFFGNPHLFQIATTHKSNDKKIGKNYDRLEFLGDALFGLLVDLSLVRQKDLDMNSLRQELVSNKTAAKWATYYKLPKLVNSNVVITSTSKINANIFEAFLGCWAKVLFTPKYGAGYEEDWEEVTRWFTNVVEVTLEHEKKAGFHFSRVNSKSSLKAAKLMKKCSAYYRNKKLGSSFLKFGITWMLCERKRTLSEGDMTMLRQNIYKTMDYKKLSRSFQQSSPLKNGKLKENISDWALVAYFIGAHIINSADKKDQYLRMLALNRWISIQLAAYI